MIVLSVTMDGGDAAYVIEAGRVDEIVPEIEALIKYYESETSLTITLKEMTQSEYDELPEFDGF